MATESDIEDVFARMLARYGTAWTGKFKGIPVEAVKRDWLETLHDINFSGLGYGLSYLPPQFPPDAMQFRMICLSAPDAPQQTRVGYRSKINREGLKRIAALLQTVVDAQRERKPTQWIDELRAKRRAGEPLSAAQKAALRDLDISRPLDVSQEIEDNGRRVRENLERLRAESAKKVVEYERAHR